MIWLATAFFATALLYASVGYGGGSTYNALLALYGVDYRLLPAIALACNIVVVTGGSIRFARAGITPWRGALVLTAIGAPAAFLGGLMPIGETAFLTLLGLALVLTALTMLVPVREGAGEPMQGARWMPVIALPLGFLAGLVGIGGGIFLAPLLHLTRWNSARAIAATASFFILINSLAGLVGQLVKGGTDRIASAVTLSLPLLIAVAIGGQIGSLFAARLLPPTWIRWLTAALTLLVGGRLLLG